MSGLEIAGLVLGAIPLVICALEHYKSGKSTGALMLKWRGQLDVLISRLKAQRLRFYFDIMELLRLAEVSQVVDRVDLTEEECLIILQDAKKGEKVQQYLGFLHAQFLEVLGRYEDCLKTIAKELRHIRRLSSADKDDISALLAANPRVDGRFEFKERLSFSIRRSKLEELVEGLREDQLSLGVIIKGMRTQRDFTVNQVSHDSRRLSTILGQVQTYARSLFKAICQSQPCKCHSAHKVMLQLHNRIPSSRREGSLGKESGSVGTFNLVFHIQDHFQEASVQVSDSAFTRDLYVCGKGPQVTVTFSDPAGVEGLQDSPRSPRKTSQICDLATKARLAGHVLNFVLKEGYLDLAEGSLESQRKLGASMTLERFLQAGAVDEDSRMTPKQQTLLALTIASSIIQLRQTSWFSIPFTSKMLKLLGETREQGNHAFMPSIPFVEQVTDPGSEGLPGPDPKPALLELAILLLEIWNHKPLEMWCAKCGFQEMETPESRTTAAIRWLEMTSERLPPHYLTAIEQCLAMYCGRLRLWSDSDFLKVYCENILKPLQESCRAW
ncbi:hypothetical protein B0I35DRAFT_424275 [Stachybotrys elegans]|uniref:DUF7580 domain-containing protein n=1 Tax=Stachybotrys elegans TaxID=80388 RepID=A0A8K0SW48_9HYPO|nr:hypothetical protein B0I35DRAFT_424275 [Stachybotrys elegans]